MKLEAGWKGLNGAIHGLDEMPRSNQVALSKAIRRSSAAVKKEVKSGAPRKSKGPHRIAAGVKSRVRGTGLATVGQVYLSGLAIPVARGPKPHEIEPRTKRALSFNGSAWASAKHPGARPNPFFDHGVAKSLPLVEKELDAAGVDIINDVVRAIDSDKG